MGPQPSTLAVPAIPDSYIVISICAYSKIRVMNVTPDVQDMLVKLDQEMTAKWGTTRGPITEYYGTLKMKVGHQFTFAPGGGKDQATLAKFFVIRLLEEMYNLGYNLLISSDLAIQLDHSTMFFAKSELTGESRQPARICCIAPGGAGIGTYRFMCNRLILLRHDEHIKTALMLALGDTWPKGVRGSEDFESLGESVHEVTLNGYWAYVEGDGVNTRKAMCNLVGRMGGLNWRLLASTNLKGTEDCYFFIYDPTFSAHPNDFCMLTLGNRDRFRLINCDHLLDVLERTIVSAGLTILDKQDYYGCPEIKVWGNPWRSHGNEAISARRSISRIMEVFGQYGYMPLYAIDFSRSRTDKASILFRKISSSVNCRWACLSLTEANRLQLLDFPVAVGAPMRDILHQFYRFGVLKEVNLPDSNLQIDVRGFPWVPFTRAKGGDEYHMRAVLGKMLAVAAQHGWYVSVSADVSARLRSGQGGGRGGTPMDADSIYFVKMN